MIGMSLVMTLTPDRGQPLSTSKQLEGMIRRAGQLTPISWADRWNVVAIDILNMTMVSRLQCVRRIDTCEICSDHRDARSGS